MIFKKLSLLKKKFSKHNIDGYLIPKNDEFFGEYAVNDRLNKISNFSGSAGLAVILKRKNLLFVDGRYTIQAKKESGNYFKIIEIHKNSPKKKLKNLTLGFDPTIFTTKQLKNYFSRSIKLKSIKKNLVDEVNKIKADKVKLFYSLKSKIVGENYSSKIKKVRNILKSNKIDYLFISAPENVAWLLNIRGQDNPNSPIPNCRLLIGKNNDLFLISEKNKCLKIIKEKKLNSYQIINPKNFSSLIKELKGKYITIDPLTCSSFFETIIKSKFSIRNKEDPCYELKSIKNKSEIQNMINSHIWDGLALTKFIYWIKYINKKKISEVDAQNKLENFRKLNKNYLFPSFSTIAGTGSNGAIVHYRATMNNTKIIKKNDIFLLDSGGQYKFGTTDVTRTICFSKQRKHIKNIFTEVLKGHIAVVQTNLKKNNIGKEIDKRARKYLSASGRDYAHGTGHGVGFFLNVHEGPQSISRYNKVKLKEGMILSNEPGFYKKGGFGIRIENLIYIKRNNNKLIFENLTLVPIEKDLINHKLLTKDEKDYLFKYHLNIYALYAEYLSLKEKKWLASLI